MLKRLTIAVSMGLLVLLNIYQYQANEVLRQDLEKVVVVDYTKEVLLNTYREVSEKCLEQNEELWDLIDPDHIYH